MKNQPSFLSNNHVVEKLDTTRVSGIGDLMRDIGRERAGAVIPAFSISRTTLDSRIPCNDKP